MPASEARAYAVRRAREDYSTSLAVNGCVNVKTGRETLWLIEAAQLLCAAKDEHAIKLVELALQSLKQEQPWKPVIPVLLAEPAEPGASGPTKAWCPYCAQYHYHGTGGGHRWAHCTEGPFKDKGYFLLTPAANSDKTKRSAHKMRRAK